MIHLMGNITACVQIYNFTTSACTKSETPLLEALKRWMYSF